MFERTVEILKDYIDSAEEVTMDSALVDDLGLSSLDVINLVATFEDEFDIEVPDRVIPTLRTVGDIVNYLEENAE
ncbi:MAG: acyl carrier protein [Lachnospiraceae bacterium]|nr:acyl carrier protein [Lachnospiraceae bacterium]